jgi:cell division initiation protein
MKITPLDVQQQEFKTRFRGYDCEEVDAFLRSVSEAMESLVKENAGLREQLDMTEVQLQGIRKKESALNDILVSTQAMAENLKQGAHREADLILKEAELKAEDVLRKLRTSTLPCSTKSSCCSGSGCWRWKSSAPCSRCSRK